MVGTGHYKRDVVRLASRADLGAISCNHDLRRAAKRRLLRHTHNHRQASNVSQRLVGQACGG
jgi:hypothetical protein